MSPVSVSLYLVLLLQPVWGEQQCRSTVVNDSVSLQEAVNQVSLLQSMAIDERGGHNCSRIELPAGVHVLTSQTLFSAEIRGLEITGPVHRDHATVVCTYGTVETNYTWYFSELDWLRIHNVHFRDCPRPLRIDSVADVEITNSSFR